MSYSLNCPKCNAERYYSSKESFRHAEIYDTVCRNCSTIEYAKRNGSCEILLNNSNVSFYWIGFILADGHICDNRLTVRLAKKDEMHLNRLAVYLQTNLHHRYGQYSLSIKDTRNISRLVENFDIKSNKTKFPPDVRVFDSLSREQLLSLFTGFVDGDGCISNLHNRKDFSLRIKTHSSWYDILRIFSEHFLDNCSVIINNQGYCSLTCGNSVVLKRIKSEIDTLDLPILLRKWDIIDLNYIGKYEQRKLNESNISKMINLGYVNKLIAEKLKLSPATVSAIINKLKNEQNSKNISEDRPQ